MTALSKTIRRRERRHRLKLALATLWCAVFAIIFLLPTVLTVTNSFMTPSEISANYGVIFEQSEQGTKKFMASQVILKFIPDKVAFSQYARALLLGPEYLLKFWNSVILVVPIVIFQVAVAALASYSFMRTRSRLKSAIFFIYIIIMLMPHQVSQVPNYMIAQTLGILETRWAIVLPGIFTPFSVFILTKSMRRIPYTMIEAAKLDGAGEGAIFSRICVPMCKSAMYSVAILVFIDYWNMVEQPLIMLSDSEMHPLSVFLSTINSGEISLAFAAATIYMIPPILIFLYGEEYLVEGITYAGGLKG